jgi:hypothetical protein
MQDRPGRAGLYVGLHANAGAARGVVSRRLDPEIFLI